MTMRNLGPFLWMLLLPSQIISAFDHEGNNDFSMQIETDEDWSNLENNCSDENILATNFSVYISARGNDSADCYCKGIISPCHTVQHAYDQIMLHLANSTSSVKFIFMDADYSMSGSFFIDRKIPSLKTIEFSSMSNTTIKALNDECVIWIGCNTSNTDPCIPYDVAFTNLNFINFGSKFPAVFVVFHVNQLLVKDCSFAHNNCSAINSLGSSIMLKYVNFTNNKGNANFENPQENYYAAFPLSNVSNGGALAFVFKAGQNKVVDISNCTFARNMAAKNLTLPYIEHSLKDTQFSRVGGAILLLFTENSSNIIVNISDSNFLNNSAYAAGAVAILSQSYSSANQISFKRCLFKNNVVKSTAGAILFANWDYTQQNRLTISDCILTHNFAKYAGAIKYLINLVKAKETSSSGPALEILNTHVCCNVAETGSALHLITDSSIFGQSMQAVNIVDSKFSQHDITGDGIGEQSVSQYGGTILTHHIDIKFIGNNTIENNKVGCGLYASNANIHVNGTLLFSKNIASASGGGMALADTSHMILYPGSHIKFKDNYSGTNGGALAVLTMGMPEMTYVYNPFCFMQYSIPNQPHSKWDAKVEFVGNSARLKGAAIFINTMTACLWSEHPPHRSFEKAFRWTGNFIYTDNYVTSMYNSINEDASNKTKYQVDIATDTYKFVLGEPKEVSLAPGERMYFNLSGLDELNSETYSVPIANSLASLKKNGQYIESHLQLPNKYFILDPYGKSKLIPLYYEVDRDYYAKMTNKSVDHAIQFFDTYSSYIAKATIKVTPILCRPGFEYDGQGKCICKTSSEIKDCDGTKITLVKGLWATKSEKGKLQTYQCPPNYCKCTKYGSDLESCIYDSSDPDSQCSENRAGVLCGNCKKNTNGLSLYTADCIECDSEQQSTARGGIVFLTIGVLFMALLIVYLNPSFSTKMRGPAFYVQMLPYMYTNNSPLNKFVRVMASVLTLGGSAGLPISGCLGPNWDRLDIIALTYVFAVIILVVLLIVYVLSRCFVIRFNRDSPFESFWILLIASYCFFSETALVFFYCVDVNGTKVFFYDGTVQCFVGRHLFMVAVSSIILLFFVLLPPLAVLMICTGRTNAPVQVVDALTKGLKLRYRWWWAVDLLRRFVYVAFFVFITKNGVKQVIYIILSNIVLTVHTLCQPYRNAFANLSEAFLLVSLTIITTLHLADNGQGSGEEIARGIVILNFTFMFSLFTYLLVLFIKSRYSLRFGNPFNRFQNQRMPIPTRPQTPGRIEND